MRLGTFRGLVGAMGVMLMALAGCSGGDGGGGVTANAAPGTLAVSLTDAPACGYDAVNVTVSKVRVHQSSAADENAAGWTDITLNQPTRINLLDYNDPTKNNGALFPLGETSLGAGHYTQVRLVLVPNDGSPTPKNSVVLSDTKEEKSLDTPSAVQSGVKLVHEFDVPSGQRVDLVLDFDACKSIVKAGNSGKYLLKPVIKVVPQALNGIEGVVSTALLSSHVVVSAQINGEIIRTTVPNAEGKFFLARLPGDAQGAYPLNYDVVITADNHATAVIAAVPVQAAPTITTISTMIGLNDSLNHSISGNVTLNPATDEAAVFVAAKQVLNSGPTVTVKSVVGTVLDNAAPIGDYNYNLMLPIGSPVLYQYIPATHVITPDLASQSLVAGQYTVRGVAQTETVGYTVQTPAMLSVNIGLVDQSNQNFALAPTP